MQSDDLEILKSVPLNYLFRSLSISGVTRDPSSICGTRASNFPVFVLNGIHIREILNVRRFVTWIWHSADVQFLAELQEPQNWRWQLSTMETYIVRRTWQFSILSDKNWFAFIINFWFHDYRSIQLKYHPVIPTLLYVLTFRSFPYFGKQNRFLIFLEKCST